MSADARLGEALTDREVQVLELAFEGHSNEAIARALHLALDTVKSRFRRVYAKLGVSNRQTAAVLALRRGLITAPGLLATDPDTPPEPGAGGAR